MKRFFAFLRGFLLFFAVSIFSHLWRAIHFMYIDVHWMYTVEMGGHFGVGAREDGHYGGETLIAVIVLIIDGIGVRSLESGVRIFGAKKGVRRQAPSRYIGRTENTRMSDEADRSDGAESRRGRRMLPSYRGRAAGGEKLALVCGGGGVGTLLGKGVKDALE